MRDKFDTYVKNVSTWFTNYRTIQSQCASDRAITLTGQYHQSNGVHNNTNFTHLDLSSLMYSWAFDAGYRVAHIGKFINGSEVSTWNTIPTWTVPGVDEHYMLANIGSSSDGIKYNWQAIERTYDRNGVLETEALFPVLAARGQSTDPQYKFFADYCRNRAVDVIERFGATGEPFLLHIWPNSPHEPTAGTDKPTIFSPDTTDRTNRMAAYNAWIPPFYDYQGYTDDNGVHHTLAGTATVTATTMTDSTATWTVDEHRDRIVKLGGAYATVISNTATTLTFARWVTLLTNTTAATPAAGAYTIGTAYPNIDTTNVTHVQGTSGLYGASPGDEVVNERNRMKALVAVDDLVADVIDALDTAGVLDNTYIFYISDNGYARGEHGDWEGKDTRYNSVLNCPFFVQGPNVPQGETNAASIFAIDIASTACALMNVSPNHAFDNVLVAGDATDPVNAVNVLDYLNDPTGLDHRVVQQTISTAPTAAEGAMNAFYKLGAMPVNPRPLYDTVNDPWEFDDISGAQPTLFATWKTYAATLGTCAGDTCELST